MGSGGNPRVNRAVRDLILAPSLELKTLKVFGVSSPCIAYHSLIHEAKSNHRDNWLVAAKRS